MEDSTIIMKKSEFGKYIDEVYERGRNDGFSQGRYEVLSTIKSIYDNAKYPEYLEMDIDEYLRMEGLK